MYAGFRSQIPQRAQVCRCSSPAQLRSCSSAIKSARIVADGLARAIEKQSSSRSRSSDVVINIVLDLLFWGVMWSSGDDEKPRMIGNHSQHFVRQIVHGAFTLPSLDDTDNCSACGNSSSGHSTALGYTDTLFLV